MRSFHRVRRLVATILLAVYLPACHHWVTPKGITPQEYVTTMHPTKVRVNLADSRRVVLENPWISSDSLWGRLVPSELWGEELSSVQSLEVRKFDMLGTVLYPLAIMGVIIAGCAVIGGMEMNMPMDLGL